jgi:hypothetical protein
MLIKFFPDFNIFDYLSIDLSGFQNDEKQKNEKKQMIIIRNNFFLGILLKAMQMSSTESNEEKQISDVSFLKHSTDTFKNIICEKENQLEIELDVEVFFLFMAGWDTRAKVLVVKFLDYFKNFIKDFKSDQEQFQSRMLFENLGRTLQKDFEEMSLDEVIILRKIINNTVIRKFFQGIEFLSSDQNYCYLMAEGRIWVSIIKHFPAEQVL